MIFYPTTTLPSSPPYTSLDDIIANTCDRCLMISAQNNIGPVDIDQFYEVAMAIIDFWFHELEKEIAL